MLTYGVSCAASGLDIQSDIPIVVSTSTTVLELTSVVLGFASECLEFLGFIGVQVAVTTFVVAVIDGVNQSVKPEAHLGNILLLCFFIQRTLPG